MSEEHKGARGELTGGKGEVQAKEDKGMNRRAFMNYAGLGALAGLSLVVLGGCGSSDGSGGEADTSGGATGTTPMVEKTVKKLDGISTYVIVKFTAMLDTTKTCYRFTWDPIPGGVNDQEGFYHKNGVTYLHSKYTNWAAYAGSVTVRINTPSLGCGANNLLCDLYGNQVPPYTTTVNF